MPSPRLHVADIVSLSIGVAWGLSFVLGKYILSFLDPISYVAITTTSAGVILSIYVVLRSRRLRLALHWRVLVLGVVLAAAATAQLFGLALSPPGVAGLIADLTIVLTPALGFAVRRTRVRPRTALAACLALGGSAALAMTRHGLSVRPGDLLVMAGAVLYSLHATLLDGARAEEGVLETTAGELLTAGLCAAVAMAALSRPWESAPPPPVLWLAIAFEVVVSTLLGYAVQGVAQRRGGSTRFALVTSVDGPAALAFGVALFAERVTAVNLVGAALVLAGVLTTHLGPAGEEAPPATRVPIPTPALRRAAVATPSTAAPP